MITTIPYGYEAFEAGYEATGDAGTWRCMEGVGTLRAEQIPVTPTGPGRRGRRLHAADHRQVVNANAYRGFLLVTAGLRFGREDWQAAGQRNVNYVVQSQRATARGPTRPTARMSSSTTSTRASC